jgi:hypothetical protein
MDCIMISRARHFYRTLSRIRSQTGSNRRAIVYAAALLRRNLTKLRLQSWQVIVAPRRRQQVASLAATLGRGEPSVGVRVSGGIGDCIVVARYLRDLLASTPAVAFDIYCSDPATAEWIFATVPGCRSIYHDILFERYFGFYDLALRVSQFVLVHGETLNRSKLHHHPALARCVDSIIRSRPDLETVIQRHPYMDNFLATIAVFRNATRRDFLHSMSDLDYGGDRLPLAQDRSILQTHGLSGQRYVVVHNGFDTNFVITTKAATKCYPHFGAVISALRHVAPDVQFVQVGSSTCQPISGVDLNLINQTSLQQVAGLIAGATLLIDNEGGLVHVAACVGTLSCVVFGPTPSRFFGYPANINVDPLFCGGCWWMAETWMDTCVRGFKTARCMQEQPPEAIVARIAPILARRAKALAAD